MRQTSVNKQAERTVGHGFEGEVGSDVVEGRQLAADTQRSDVIVDDEIGTFPEAAQRPGGTSVVAGNDVNRPGFSGDCFS